MLNRRSKFCHNCTGERLQIIHTGKAAMPPRIIAKRIVAISRTQKMRMGIQASACAHAIKPAIPKAGIKIGTW
jgi:hypothetical protein